MVKIYKNVFSTLAIGDVTFLQLKQAINEQHDIEVANLLSAATALYDALKNVNNLNTHNKLRDLVVNSFIISVDGASYDISTLKIFDKTKIFADADVAIQTQLKALARNDVTFASLQSAIILETQTQAAAKSLFDELIKIDTLKSLKALNTNVLQITVDGNSQNANIEKLKILDGRETFANVDFTIQNQLIVLVRAKVSFGLLKTAIDAQTIQEAAKVLYDELQKISNLETYNKLKNLDADSITIPGNGSPYNIAVLKGFDKSKSFAGVTDDIKNALKVLATDEVTFAKLASAINTQSIQEAAKALCDELIKEGNSDTLTKLEKLDVLQIFIDSDSYNITHLKTLDKTQVFANAIPGIQTELKDLASADVTFNDFKAAINTQRIQEIKNIQIQLYNQLKNNANQVVFDQLKALKVFRLLVGSKKNPKQNEYNITHLKTLDKTQVFANAIPGIQTELKTLASAEVTFDDFKAAINTQRIQEIKNIQTAAKNLYDELVKDENLNTLTKLKKLDVSQIPINSNSYNIVILKNLNKTQVFANAIPGIQTELKTLASADVTFNDLKAAIDAQTPAKALYDELIKDENSDTLTKLKKLDVLQIFIDSDSYNITRLKTLDKTQVFANTNFYIRVELTALVIGAITFNDLKTAIDTQHIQEAVKVLYGELIDPTNSDTYNQLKDLVDASYQFNKINKYSIIALKTKLNKNVKIFANTHLEVQKTLKDLVALKVTFDILKNEIATKYIKDVRIRKIIYDALIADVDIFVKIKSLNNSDISVLSKISSLKNKVSVKDIVKSFDETKNFVVNSPTLKIISNAMSHYGFTFDDLKTAIDAQTTEENKLIKSSKPDLIYNIYNTFRSDRLNFLTKLKNFFAEYIEFYDSYLLKKQRIYITDLKTLDSKQDFIDASPVIKNKFYEFAKIAENPKKSIFYMTYLLSVAHLDSFITAQTKEIEVLYKELIKTKNNDYLTKLKNLATNQIFVDGRKYDITNLKKLDKKILFANITSEIKDELTALTKYGVTFAVLKPIIIAKATSEEPAIITEATTLYKELIKTKNNDYLTKLKMISSILEVDYSFKFTYDISKLRNFNEKILNFASAESEIKNVLLKLASDNIDFVKLVDAVEKH